MLLYYACVDGANLKPSPSTTIRTTKSGRRSTCMGEEEDLR
jgi:hypothetical protein